MTFNLSRDGDQTLILFGHRNWREAYARGEAGVFSIPLDQVMAWLANMQAANANQPEGEPAEELMGL